MMSDMKTQSEQLGVILTKLERIEKDIQEIKDRLDKDYVTKDEFRPIERVVYGLVTTVLISFVGAVMALIMR